MAWNTSFTEWSPKDQELWTARAKEWKLKHEDHVSKLLSHERLGYEPSGSDCGKPELWKGGHWHWFLGN